MTVYTVGLIMPLAFYILNIVIKNTMNQSVRQMERFFSSVLFLYYLVLSGFRANSVGTDLVNYLWRFEMIAESPWRELPSYYDRWGFEYGYLVFCKLIGYISKSEQWYLFVTSFFVLVLTHYIIKRYSLSPCLSYYFYVVFVFFGTSMNMIRLFMALAICMLAIDDIVKKNLKRYIIIIVIASLFHTTALVFLLLYPFCKIKITKDTLIMYTIGCLIVYFFGESIILFLLRYGSSYYYNRYASGLGSGSGLGMLLLLVIIFAYCFWNYSRTKGKIGLKAEQQGMTMFEEYYSIWMHMLLFAIALNMLALQLMIAGRLMWYMKLGLIFLLPNTFQVLSMKNKSDLMAAIMFIVCCIIIPIIYYNSTMAADNAGIVPYMFY